MNFKKIFLSLLGLSNGVVLTLIFGLYFQNNYNKASFYSSLSESKAGNSEQHLRDKINQKCKKQIEEVLKNKRSEYICVITTSGKESKASYTLETKFIIRKKGNTFSIQGTGNMKAATRHATESGFCEDCKEERGSTKDNVLHDLTEIAKIIDQKAMSAVINAKSQYRKKHLSEGIYKAKAENCEGEWNSYDKEFYEFDTSETLKCQFSKLSGKNFLERESFYNNSLKEILWEMALSEDYESLNDFDLQRKISQAFQDSSFSVTASSNILNRYTQWRSRYDNHGDVPYLRQELNKIVRDLETSRNVDPQIQHDLNYFSSAHPTTETSYPVNTFKENSTHSIKDSVRDLY